MITSYSTEYQENIRHLFLLKFEADKRTAKAKLEAIGMSKGGLHSLIHKPTASMKKRTIETMRAYLENRQPRFKTKDGYGWCSGCEEVKFNPEFRDKWTCFKCHEAMDMKSAKNTGRYYKALTKRLIKQKTPGIYRTKYLGKKRLLHLKKNYGEFYKCILMVRKLRKEVIENEQSN